jgi:hypothetical protein
MNGFHGSRYRGTGSIKGLTQVRYPPGRRGRKHDRPRPVPLESVRKAPPPTAGPGSGQVAPRTPSWGTLLPSSESSFGLEEEAT